MSCLKFVSDAFEPRTRANHKYHCNVLEGAASDHLSTTYGVKFDSYLNSSKYFHVVDGLAPDVMHDVLEGVAQYEVKELLKYLINKKIIPLSEFNKQLDEFPYSYVDIKDKPTAITTSILSSTVNSVKQKGII